MHIKSTHHQSVSLESDSLPLDKTHNKENICGSYLDFTTGGGGGDVHKGRQGVKDETRGEEET